MDDGYGRNCGARAPARAPGVAPRMTPALQPLLTALRDRLDALYGERLVGLYLYGSQARGDATTESDVDVLVVLDGDVRLAHEVSRMVDATDDVVLASGKAVSLMPMPAARFREGASVFLRHVRREAVAL